MANLHTPATYKRLTADKDYMDKTVDAYIRANYGQHTSYEVRGDNIIIGDGSVMKLATLQRQAIDMQTQVEERPELNKVLQDRQKRQEQSARVDNTIANPKSTEQMQAEQAQKYMRQNAQNKGHVPKTTRTKGSTSNLPSDNPQ